MQPTSVFDRLLEEGLISPDSHQKNVAAITNDRVSIHWDIKTNLYLGVSLLSAGLGTLVYKNIDTIGHQVILLVIALISMGSFYYCTSNKLPFSTAKVAAPHPFFDYILLLACSTFVSFIVYLQFQYNVFGNRYGLATFFPMLVLFFSAYYFDHLGVLSMAIVALGAWAGLTITPLHLIDSNDFNQSSLLFTAMALGALLVIIGWFARRQQMKAHFEFTYSNFGIHLLMVSCIAAMFHFDAASLFWCLVLLVLAYLFYRKAIHDTSFYIVLVIILYAYFAISYVVVRMLGKVSDAGIGMVYLGFIYFIVSAIMMVLFLINTNKKLKAI